MMNLKMECKNRTHVTQRLQQGRDNLVKVSTQNIIIPHPIHMQRWTPARRDLSNEHDYLREGTHRNGRPKPREVISNFFASVVRELKLKII